MRIRKNLTLILLGLMAWVLIGTSCNFIMSRMSDPTPVEDVDVTPNPPTVTSPVRLPPTVEPLVTGPPESGGDDDAIVSGLIELEDGRCCAGGTAGETIQVAAAFMAESDAGQVTEMRTSTLGSGCQVEPSAGDLTWEPYADTKEFPFQLAINWVGFNVWVQFRDDQGNLSSFYCDDISIEGMPAPPPGS